MPRQLLLLRHAKSDWKANVDSDYERPLSKRGIKDAPRMGRWLAQQALYPDLVVSSGATRARRTARAVCATLAIPKDKIRWDERIYEATTGTLLAVLADCPPAAGRVLLVGHNPGLEQLLIYLCGSGARVEPGAKLLPTTALAVIDTEREWSELNPDCGQLVQLVRVRELPEEAAAD